MIPLISANDFSIAVLLWGLYVGGVVQLITYIAGVPMFDEEDEPLPNKKTNTDNDECSSEQSLPRHRAVMSRSKRHGKKKTH